MYTLFCEIFPQSLHPLPPQVMFKLGDDLRQDQLILQLIMLMDRLLRRENLDLKLTPYNVLACSGNHGIILALPTSPILPPVQPASFPASFPTSFPGPCVISSIPALFPCFTLSPPVSFPGPLSIFSTIPVMTSWEVTWE